MSTKHKKLLDEFLLCLDEKRYYDAHEALEEIWYPRRFEKNDEMNLLKGFINASVSFELVKRNREESSKKVWKNYLKYRPLLYKIKSPFINDYHSLCRAIDKIYLQNTI
ncbi:MAG: DUF309 domain-containing protein [Campylobacterota bacterium]|nr:DUF309 domain-containing protein [Campylobacterota bacterium]